MYIYKAYSSFIYKAKLLSNAVKVIKNADAKLFFLLCLVVATSTILPVLAIKSSADIINKSVSHAEPSLVYTSLIIWGMVLFAHDIISPVISFLQSNLGDKAVFFINKSIFNKSNSLNGLEQFENPQFYNDLQIISTQAYSRPINLVVTVIGLFKDACLIFYCLSLLFFNISYLSLIILACVILQTRITTKIQTDMWLESLGRSMRSRMMNYISSLSINQACAKEIRLFPISKYLYARYLSLFKEIYSSMFKLRLRLILWPVLPSIILLLGNVFALNETIKLIENKTLEIGVIAILIQCFMQLHTAVLSLGEQSGWLSGHLLFFEKYFDFLSKTEDSFFSNKKKFNKPFLAENFHINNIKFENVSFNYPDQRAALKNINFEISSIDRLAIVGSNGSGKTTIVKLICGFYKPTSGKILINDLSLEFYDLKLLRKLIAPVFQDFGTYALTVEENITMGATLNNQKLAQILKQAEAEFAYDLPNKVQQQLGKMFGGTDLSIGQWQKIAIARAIYKGGDLFILDEPTASLDPLSEQEIFEHFAKICSDKMTIFITHRLTTIGMSNKILLLENGKQMAFGSHEELINNSPLYKKMFNAQASKFLKLKKNNY